MSAEPTLRRDWRDTPNPRRLLPDHPRRSEILERHRAAIEQGIAVYADPTSGLSVFTAEFLARRGDCCDSGCRHCPFAVEF